MIPPVFTTIQTDTVAAGVLTDNGLLKVFPWGQAPQTIKPPYVTYTMFNGLPANTMGERPLLDNLGTQVDVWGRNGDQCTEVATAVRNALEGMGHMTSISSMEREPDTQLYRVRMDFDFFTDR